MVDFKHLAAIHSASQVLDPRDIFSRLPKPINIDDLHTSQAEVLDNWFEHRAKKDTVIKLNTGGGKTIIGLLAALSSSRELGRGSLYLVDNKQLAQQVYDQAKSLGIETQIYTGRDSLNASFKNGESILIATYQALFNGKSAFGVGTPIDPIDVSAIIVDDAHSSFDTIRDAFTVKIQRNDYPDLFSQITQLLREGFISVDLGPAFDDFTSGVQSVGEDVLEVPFWTWIDHSDDVAQIIAKVLGMIGCDGEDDTSKSLRFSWPLIKNDLRYCQAVIGRDVFSISPILPLIDMFPTFMNASRRIYMSATFADEGAIIRTFGCSHDDMNIISPNTVAGVGRRMIIEIAGNKSYFDVLTTKM